MLEFDIDDVPWREQLTTAVPEIRDGALTIPSGAGWGVDVNEEVLAEHPWP
jgi:L-alanine-DL-glutamate epimerase-like enolase superfamily enzyme